jgi:3-hydroxy-9,10-secoandrosta-1,3,5(10)-triene-9,17-dione monooxygenase
MQHAIRAVPRVTMKLVEMAKRVTPELASRATEDNMLRRLSDDTWGGILLDGGFVRSLQPARWGGGEVSLLEFADAIMELARESPSAGWVGCA